MNRLFKSVLAGALVCAFVVSAHEEDHMAEGHLEQGKGLLQLTEQHELVYINEVSGHKRVLLAANDEEERLVRKWSSMVLDRDINKLFLADNSAVASFSAAWTESDFELDKKSFTVLYEETHVSGSSSALAFNAAKKLLFFANKNSLKTLSISPQGVVQKVKQSFKANLPELNKLAFNEETPDLLYCLTSDGKYLKLNLKRETTHMVEPPRDLPLEETLIYKQAMRIKALFFSEGKQDYDQKEFLFGFEDHSR